MSTFIERHGYVRYPVRGYRLEGQTCEMKGCAEYSRIHVEFINSLIQERSLSFTADDRTPRKFVLDHCHEHRWIRGVLCNSCNMVMLLADNDPTWNRKGWSEHLGIQMGYQEYRLNCPECAGKDKPKKSIVGEEYLIPRIECPVCHGAGSIPMDTGSGSPNPADCYIDVECSRCDGIGKVGRLRAASCDICGKYRDIVDDTYGMCKECFSNECDAYGEAEFCLTHGGDIGECSEAPFACDVYCL
jgi:hypothetical protein